MVSFYFQDFQLLQQCPACLVRLTWIVSLGGRWPYSWCLVGCCCQDLFRIARSILVETVSSAPIRIGITVTFMFFLVLWQDVGIYLSFSVSFIFTQWSTEMMKPIIRQIIISIGIFHISVSWWSFTRVWVTASLLKSPGLFSVFRSFSIMLLFGWSPLVHQLPTHVVHFVIL